MKFLIWVNIKYVQTNEQDKFIFQYAYHAVILAHINFFHQVIQEHGSLSHLCCLNFTTLDPSSDYYLRWYHLLKYQTLEINWTALEHFALLFSYCLEDTPKYFKDDVTDTNITLSFISVFPGHYRNQYSLSANNCFDTDRLSEIAFKFYDEFPPLQNHFQESIVIRLNVYSNWVTGICHMNHRSIWKVAGQLRCQMMTK